MADQPTCGQGLAEHSVIPARIGELLASLAENFQAHIPTLDLADPHARVERDAYDALASEFAAIATRLQGAARQMAGHRDLPMARHLEAAESMPRIMAAFERFVQLQGEVVELLQVTVRRDQEMLDRIGG